MTTSGGSCKCPERKKPISERKWVVIDRNCNHSAFNGYHCTPSTYSALNCQSCGSVWRTDAKYVADLSDGTYKNE